jgi:molecular chaperone DnaK
VIVSDSGISEAEIESMVADAERFRDQDTARKEAAEARNRLDGLVYTTRRSLDEFGSSLSPQDAGAIRAALAESERAVDSNNPERIQLAHEGLVAAGQRLAEAIYASVSADPGPVGETDELVDDE